MPGRPDLLAEVLRLVGELTYQPPPRRQRFDWEESEADQRARRERQARKAEEERVHSEERRRKREAEARRLAEQQAQRTGEDSALGQASQAAWRAYLATPAARSAYGDYGFEVVEPVASTERFVARAHRRPTRMMGGWQDVESAETGERLTASTAAADGSPTDPGLSAIDAEGVVQTRSLNRWIALRHGDDSPMALALCRGYLTGRTEYEGVIDRPGMIYLSRFLNGYPGGWIELTEPGEQVTLLALRPGGLAIYEEARRQFRSRWEAAQFGTGVR